MIVNFTGINKKLYDYYSGLSKTGHYDFMEKYHRSYQFFCLHTFELIMTIIIMLEQEHDSIK